MIEKIKQEIKQVKIKHAKGMEEWSKLPPWSIIPKLNYMAYLHDMLIDTINKIDEILKNEGDPK